MLMSLIFTLFFFDKKILVEKILILASTQPQVSIVPGEWYQIVIGYINLYSNNNKENS